MRKAVLILTTLAAALTACHKHENTPQNSSPARDITVEYRVTSTSGHVVFEYMAPVNGASGLVKQSGTYDRTYGSYSFTYKSKNLFSITAWNTDHSAQNITVDIYVDGQLFKSGSLDHTTATASASGIVE